MNTRTAITHDFRIGGEHCYLTVGFSNSTGQPCEVFLKISKQGSTLGGLCDSLGRLISTALQYNVPLEVLCRRMIGQNFQPNGMTTNPRIPSADSIVDYVFRWLELELIKNDGRRIQSLSDDSRLLSAPSDGSEARAEKIIDESVSTGGQSIIRDTEFTSPSNQTPSSASTKR